MNYYKLEAVQNALSFRGARRVSVGPKPRVEVWRRTVGDHHYHATLAWEHDEEIISEEELTSVADALDFRDHKALIAEVKNWRDGGLWLGPLPPSRKL